MSIVPADNKFLTIIGWKTQNHVAFSQGTIINDNHDEPKWEKYCYWKELRQSKSELSESKN